MVRMKTRMLSGRKHLKKEGGKDDTVPDAIVPSGLPPGCASSFYAARASARNRPEFSNPKILGMYLPGDKPPEVLHVMVIFT